MTPRAAAAALILPLLAAAPASAACSIEVRVENRGSGALEILPWAFDSRVHLLRGMTAEEAIGGRSTFGDWQAETVLEPGEAVVHVFKAEPGATCAERRRFQMAYRCLGKDIKGIAFAPYPPEDGTRGRVTIPLTRCE